MTDLDSDDDAVPWIPPPLGCVPNFPIPNDVPVRPWVAFYTLQIWSACRLKSKVALPAC
jgi:hypothetical protein